MSSISRRNFIAALAGASPFAGESGAATLDRFIASPGADRVPPADWSSIATTCRECPAGCGMRMSYRDGRVTKAEGNPEHPVNFGALCPRGQSSVQGLYDPDRVSTPLTADGQPIGWDAALAAIGERIRRAKGRVAVMSGLETGSMRSLIETFARSVGTDRMIFYEPISYDPVRAAHRTLYGIPAIPDHHIEECDTVLSLGADFLENWVSPVGYARLFSHMHSYRGGHMGRFLYSGPRRSMTAANADDPLILPPGLVWRAGAAILRTIIARGRVRSGAVERLRSLIPVLPESVPGVAAVTIERWARLFAESGKAIAIGGPAGIEGTDAYLSALTAALLNEAADSSRGIVDFTRKHAVGQVAERAEVRSFLDSLTRDDLLIICSANPAYSMPESAAALRRTGTVVTLCTMPDETYMLADWVLPVDSPLESWGDYEPLAGCVSLSQPAMARLHDTRPAGDILIALAREAGAPIETGGKPVADFKDWLDRSWRTLLSGPGGENGYRERRRNALIRGVISIKTPEVIVPKTIIDAAAEAFRTAHAYTPSPGRVELFAWPSIMLFDGAGANRGWLQELPEPVSAITWGSWIEMHPDTASSMGISDGRIVRISTPSGAIEAPVRVTIDVARGVAAIPFGQGHTALGKNAAGRGTNAFALFGKENGANPSPIVKIALTKQVMPPARGIGTTDQNQRHILQWTTPKEIIYSGGPAREDFDMPLPEGYDRRRDLYPPRTYREHRWAMVIDLARCIGCGACTVACRAENNIPVVGEAQIRKHREMDWITVIPYRSEETAERIGFIPLLCQHCDAAPCEPVCPVFASVHNDEGLNAQIYNRCIGTRYCSHNCPYKVRRFNWFGYTFPEPLDLQLNPEVTVRSRGVMEKCTFCIQRIRRVEYRAKLAHRRVRDGEIVPACAQTCPTKAIAFGDLLDPAAEVTKLTRRDPRRYHVLEELNTKPGVAYLKRVRHDETAG
jgi:anaerobic selenocysteine-containing dehydrogenase/Fe-S-cluster-containing dehydrogenase component